MAKAVTEPREAGLVILETPASAQAALQCVPAGECKHVLARCADETMSKFARRVIHRVRKARKGGFRIRNLSCVVDHRSDPLACAPFVRLTRALARALDSDATFTLVAARDSLADGLTLLETLRLDAKHGVQLNLLRDGGARAAS